MPFGGGGGGALPAHEHTNIPNDGGPLDFNNTTVGSMNSGDLTYSDGAALQQLAIAAPDDQLRVSAGNIPEWFTPSAGPSAWEELANVTATSGTSISTPVFTPKKYLMIWSFLNVSAGMSFRVGSTTLDTGSNYAQTEMYTDGTTVATGAQAGRSNLECFWNTSGGICLVSNNIVNIAAQQKVMDISTKAMAASSTGGIKNFGGLWYNNTNQIDIVGWSGSTITEANIVVWGRD